MNSSYPLFWVLAVASPAALLISGCTKSDTSNESSAKALAVDAKVRIFDAWDDIKDYTFEKRGDFTASIDRMDDKLDLRIRETNAKLAGLPDAAAKDRNRAMKDLSDARADLKAKMTDLGHATADTWVEAKAKVAEACQHVQVAYDRVK